MQSRLSRFLQASLACGIAAMLVVAWMLALVPAPAPAASSESFLERVGELNRFSAEARAALGADLVPQFETAGAEQKSTSGTGIAIPEVRQLWQFYPNQGLSKTGVLVRDLDTLKIKNVLTFNEVFDRSTRDPSFGGDWVHAIDIAGRRLFLLSCACLAPHPQHKVHEIDLRTFKVTTRELPGRLDFLNSNFVLVGGMTYDRFQDDLLLLYGGPAALLAANMNTFLYRMDVGVPSEPFDATRLYRIRSCTGPITSTDINSGLYDWEMLVTADHLYVPCQRAGHTVIVVRMARPASNDPQHAEDVAAGPVYGEAVFADPHSGRLFAISIDQEIWAFETSTMSFVGVVATNQAGRQDATGYGLDRQTGRLFFQSSSFGLGVVEGRFFPIPQARTLPRRAQGQERILADAATQRIFVLEGRGLGSTKAEAYRIYRTDKAPAPPAPPDPDRNTVDRPEQEGVTEARYNASGSGYGTRILLAKGYATVPPAPSLGSNAPTAALGETLRSKCGYTDRDIFAGRVIKAEYDTGSSAAAAIAVDIDGNTKQDLNKPSRCELLVDEDERWDFKPAECAASQDNVPDEDGRGSPENVGPSKAKCPPPGGRLEVEAETRFTGVVEVDRAWTKTIIERPPARGVRTTVESVAQGVSIGGMLHIGEVRAKAQSRADGRPQRGNMSTYGVTISHVRFGDTSVCEAACDPVRLENALNTLAGGRVVFRTGLGSNSGRDDDLLTGSRRGAQTAVQKSTARQASDRALVGDFTVEIPALEMTVFNDTASWGRARQIYQFAGVASSATYNIVMRPRDVPFEDPVFSGGLTSGDGGGTPFPDVTNETSGDGTFGLSPAQGVGNTREDGLSGSLLEPFRALARGIRLFFTNPRHSLPLLTAWALLSSPAVLSRRRRLLTEAQSADHAM